MYGRRMRNEVLSRVAAAALLGSMGAADAKQPVKLTDAQLDMATAGYAAVGNYGFTTGVTNFPLVWSNGGPQMVPQLSMTNSMNGVGTMQSNQTTAPNVVQQNSTSTIIGTGPF